MTRKTAEKIYKPHTPLNAKDLTSEQKKFLYARMSEYGATEAWAYTRFFRDGFSAWEIDGIENMRRDFIERNLDPLLVAFYNNIHIGEIPTDKNEKLCQMEQYLTSEPGNFFNLIGNVRGLKMQFTREMSAAGMGVGTVFVRFPTDNWKSYELCGIRSIWEGFLHDEAI